VDGPELQHWQLQRRERDGIASGDDLRGGKFDERQRLRAGEVRE
jgi:hypothetical protein